MTMTNLAMEMGVKCAFVPPDAKTEEYLRGRLDASKRYQPVTRTRTPSMKKNSRST
jgi:homoaconitase/3-isopropylmalate dehydratase large subunit